MDEEEVIEEEEGADMGTVILMLGLYLILLAFFILLNTMAVISEEKFEQASESVSEGFGFRRKGEIKTQDTQDITMETVYNLVSNELETLVETYISVKDFNFSQNADQMVLRLKTEAIFAPGELRIKPELSPFFTDLADTLVKPRPGTHMVGEVMVHSLPADLAGKPGEHLELSGRRSTLFTRALIERGIKDRDIAAGVRDSENATSEIIVKFHVLITDMNKAIEGAS